MPNSRLGNKSAGDQNIGRLAMLACLSICCGAIGAVLSLNECPSPDNYSHVGGVEKQCTTIGYWVFGSLGFIVIALTSVWANHLVVLILPQLAYRRPGMVFVVILAIGLTLFTWFVAYLSYGTLLFMDGPHFDVLFENK